MRRMKNIRSYQLVAAAVLAVALAAAGVAAAAGSRDGSAPLTSKPPTSRSARFGGPMRGDDGLLAAAASYLGLSTTTLQDDLQSGKTLAQVADAVTGKSSTGLVDALVAADRQRITDLVDGKGGFAPPDGGPLAAAASYLGLTVGDLQADLRGGKTLAQVADATAGKSAAGLVDALVVDLQRHLADAVKAGRITQAQADRMAADAKARIGALVNGTGRPGFEPHDGLRVH
jgi:hypothetical protein